MIQKYFFNTLFDKDDHICYGGKYETTVSEIPETGGYEYFSINALDPFLDYGHATKETYSKDVPRRADINVSKFRNFLFEMDGISLPDQIRVLKASNIEFSTVLFSGSKSLHAIISLEQPLNVEVHTFPAIIEYKNIWRRLCGYIDLKARDIGISPAKGSISIVDQSCKNPSRFSRFPMTKRSNGNLQSVIEINNRMPQDMFHNLIEKCPKYIISETVKASKPEKSPEDEDSFWAICSKELLNNIRYASWASDTGMYPVLYRITTWAIDETNVDKNLFLDILNKYTFPRLLKSGYPKHKLTIAIDHAYQVKGVK